MKQYLLIAISSILMTISWYHFFQYFYVKTESKRDLYFAISTFGGSLFALFAFLMTGRSPELILWLHRLRMLGLMICISAWAYCMYDIYFQKSMVPRIYFIFTLFIAVLLPTKWFLSLPVVHYHILWRNMEFNYFYATTNIAYSIYALSVLIFFIYSFFRVILCNRPPVAKIYGLMAFFPGVVGGINDFAVTHGLIKNIMISEYLVFGFLMSIFILFLKKEKENYLTLKRLNFQLEDEVNQRTADLTNLNLQLTRENIQRKQAEKEKQKVIEDLSSALEKVRTLSGLLPICARCKKIRDDKGYWNQIEAYIKEHSDVDFTHSICPDCARELYGDSNSTEQKNSN